MKLKIIICVLFSGLCFNSCKKNKNTLPTSGNGSATFNGTKWEANSVRGGMTDSTINFSLDIDKLNEFNDPYPYESLFIHIYINKEKQFLLNGFSIIPTAKFYTLIEQGHASNEDFDVLESDTENNWVQITEEKNGFKEIKGKFSLTLIKTSTGIDPNRYPDTLRIRDGVFSVTLD